MTWARKRTIQQDVTKVGGGGGQRGYLESILPDIFYKRLHYCSGALVERISIMTVYATIIRLLVKNYLPG